MHGVQAKILASRCGREVGRNIDPDQTCPSSACIADSHVGLPHQRGRWRPANSSIPSRAIRRT